MLARDRVRMLLDDQSQFLEFGMLAGHQVYDEDVPCAGIVAGIGQIHGVQCMILANDATVKLSDAHVTVQGGTMYPLGVRKQLRAQDIAMQNALPIVYLVDSGGAFLPLQSEIFADARHGGRVFYNQAHMSALGIPQFSIVCGSCTAGAAYVPAMTDQAVIVKGIGTIFLAGPPLVRAATGEVVSAEDLGGASVHCYQSGLTDHFAAKETDALDVTRHLIEACNHEQRKEALWGVIEQPTPSLFDPEELSYIVPLPGPASEPYPGLPMRSIVARLADGSGFVEYKEGYGTSIMAGFAWIGGHPVGIVANSYPLLCRDGARKAANFVALCEQRNLPTVFLVDVHGFDAPPEDPHMLKSAALLLRAVACSTMPKISVTVGRAVGPASYAMCGRAMGPHFSMMWPSATTSIANPEEMASQVDEKSLAAIRKQEGALYAAARLWTDFVVPPGETRTHIISCLDIARLGRLKGSTTDFGVVRL